MGSEQEVDDVSLRHLLVDVFENGIINVEKNFIILQILNRYNNDFITENILCNFFDENKDNIYNHNSYFTDSLTFSDTILLNKIITYFTVEKYDKLYGFIDTLKSQKNVISSYLIIKYLQLYCLYTLWDEKTSLMCVVDDGLSTENNYSEEEVLNLKIDGKSDLQELKEIKLISVAVPVNLPFILNEINTLIVANLQSEDLFALSSLYFLKGVIFNKQGNKKKAIEALTNSLKLNPYNWEAFKEMSKCVDRVEEVSILLDYISKEIQYTLLFEFFQIECWFFFFQASNRDIYIEKLTSLLSIFPTSKYLIIKNATLAFELKDFVQSELLFDRLASMDEYSLEAMDLYSNILYVTGNLPKLKSLFVQAKIIDELSLECQIIAGNFESLMKNHEKAILHFKRAIKLITNDSTQKSKVYTLIGHEFIEMTNHHAAIFSYRKATTLDSRNYSAWMGLGLGYDILKQYQFSIYYYQKCVSIKADDSRGWLSMAECYINLGKWNQALDAFTRSYENSVIRNKKAKCAEKIINLYLKQLNNLEGARIWNKKLLIGSQKDDYYISACKWLCEDALENLKDSHEAKHYWTLLKNEGVILEEYQYLE
ncbi:hypothetical protein QEN19_002438 [Hanseniaspora menglaensis]